MAVSMHDVARHAGVSQRTVSNVVTGSVPVAPATKARVEASIDELGYRPNTAARRLRSGRTSTVTLGLPSLHERYFADLAAAVVDEAERRGLKVLVETTRGDRERELELARGGELLTDGLILSATGLTDADEEIRHPEHPLVLVGDREHHTQIDHVGADNRAAADAAVTHLLELGRRRIAVLGHGAGPEQTTTERLAGYADALRRFGLEPDPALAVHCEWTYVDGARGTHELLARVGRAADALFALNDSAALGALRALQSAGLRVPDDVAVVGFDDILEASVSFPSLTSVGPSFADLAAAALDLLAEQAREVPGNSARVPVRRTTPFTLYSRESTLGVR